MKRKLHLLILVCLSCSLYCSPLQAANQPPDKDTAYDNALITDFSQRIYQEYLTLLSIFQRCSSAIPQNPDVAVPDSQENLSAVDKVIYQKGFTYESVPASIQAIMYGNSYKTDCTIPWSDLRYVSVLYYNFDGESVSGEIICNKAIAQDLVEIFYELHAQQYPIEEIRLIDYYQADDELSMEHNNTSCFNFRTVAGKTTLSKHAQGMAIDINPFYNPYVTTGNNGQPAIAPAGSEPYADRNADFPYKITTDDLCYQLFTAHGFTWGGNWKNSKDYQHFQK